jgi:exosortase A-associated hydrolase 1
MGDSTGDKRDFLGVTPDIGAAIDAMQQWLPTLQHVVLWGLCDGASAALLYCQATGDTRVTGLCLLNPWIRSEASLARTQVKHYYTQRMRQKEFWQKLLSGQVAMGAARGFMRNIRVAAMRPSRRAADSGTAPPFQTQMAMGWLRFGGPIELILSGDDYTAKEFLEYCAGNPLWSEALAQAQVRRHDIAGADHTYSNGLDRMKVEARTIQMLSQCSRPRT